MKGGTVTEDKAREGIKEGQAGEVEGLHAKFHVNVFIVLPSGGQKPPFWAIFNIWGLVC